MEKCSYVLLWSLVLVPSLSVAISRYGDIWLAEYSELTDNQPENLTEVILIGIMGKKLIDCVNKINS